MIENKSDKRGQVQIISVESLVPKNHLLRKVDKVIDFNFIYDLVKDTYCQRRINFVIKRRLKNAC